MSTDKGKQMTFHDLEIHDIERFRLEECGRSYAVHYMYEPLIDMYRKIYYAYPYKQRNGEEEIDNSINTGIFESDIKKTLDECIKQ